MNKFIFRIITVVALSETLIFNINWSTGIIFFKTTDVGYVCNIITGIGVFYLWGYMFYHWGMHVFSKRAYKVLWFWVMFLGLFVGAFVYYIFVYELGKTLKGN